MAYRALGQIPRQTHHQDLAHRRPNDLAHRLDQALQLPIDLKTYVYLHIKQTHTPVCCYLQVHNINKHISFIALLIR